MIYWKSESIPTKQGIFRCSDRTTTISIDFAQEDFAYCAKNFRELGLRDGFVHQLQWYLNRKTTYAKDLVSFQGRSLGHLEFEIRTVMN